MRTAMATAIATVPLAASRQCSTELRRQRAEKLARFIVVHMRAGYVGAMSSRMPSRTNTSGTKIV